MEDRYDCGNAQAAEQGQILPQETPPAEILRDGNGQFLPGQSPNPNGRPKRTEEERAALEKIRMLAPGVADHMIRMLNDPKVSAASKIRILEIILERTYGKPETAVRLNTDLQNNEAARARLEAIAARIRLEVE